MSQETEIEVLKTVVGKIDQSLEKMTEVSNNLSKILAVHEQRIDSLERQHNDVEDESRILHKRITELFGEMGDKLRSMEDRLELKFQQQQMAASNQHDAIQKEIQKDISDLSVRLRKLENWRWWMMGMGVGFGVVLAKVIPLFLA